MKTSLKIGLSLGMLLLLATAAAGQAVNSDSWAATDALGRKVREYKNAGDKKKDKFVGIFYLTWHMGRNDTTSQVKNITEIVRQHPEAMKDYNHPAWGTSKPGIFFWDEPLFGYYKTTDPWVLRKHAEMLADAGIDVVFCDCTNGTLTYSDSYEALMKTWDQAQKDGVKVPKIAFLLPFGAVPNSLVSLRQLYNDVYKPGRNENLWFRWKGKPLIFCPPEGITPDMAGFFTVRHSWFCSAWDWFGDGHDKCPWADIYPQKYGWHDRPDKPEMIAVSPATHPIVTNDMKQVGRSYHDGAQPDKEHWRSGEGLCFREQFERAMEVDPEFIYFSGWNEWTAMRFVNPGGIHKVGEYDCKKGDSYFVDLFNHEFSRDIEPLRGDFGDNYYYQLCDFIRRYKGVEPTPVYSAYQTIDLGDMQAWNKVKAEFADDKGDVFHRNHYGYGSVGQYVNNTGRNDILTAKVANDGKTLYFYVRTAAPVTPFSDPKWMRLFLDVKGSESGNWEGFQYRINNDVTDNKTSLEKSLNGWNWQKIADLDYRVAGNELVVAVPAQAIGIANANDFAIDFKWIDNAVEEGDIQECLSDGDAAPNGRFRYRYQFKK